MDRGRRCTSQGIVGISSRHRRRDLAFADHADSFGLDSADTALAGEPVARAMRHLGVGTIRGSAGNKKKAKKDKGGARAVVEAVKLLKSGGAVCITPDGPRGPNEQVSLGAILIAQRSGAPILPYAVATKPAKRLDSWDRFIIPFPFTKGAIVFGELLETPRDAKPEDLRDALQQRLDAATRRADVLAGYELTPPSAGTSHT